MQAVIQRCWILSLHQISGLEQLHLDSLRSLLLEVDSALQSLPDTTPPVASMSAAFGGMQFAVVGLWLL